VGDQALATGLCSNTDLTGEGAPSTVTNTGGAPASALVVVISNGTVVEVAAMVITATGEETDVKVAAEMVATTGESSIMGVEGAPSTAAGTGDTSSTTREVEPSREALLASWVGPLGPIDPHRN